MTEPQFTVSLPPEVIDAIADAVAERLGARSEEGGFLNSESAARYLDAPVSRVHDLSERGELTPRRDGRRLLFKRSDLDAYVDHNQRRG